jgi:segregation and condensation protein A
VSASTLDRYQLRLPSFEGPLDVLLQLIERERLEISDVSLVLVVDGFLAYVAGLDDRNPALLAGFLTIASRLLVLKSRAMLPRPQSDPEEEDEDDLAEQLRQYQQAKLAAGYLRERDSAGLRSFARPSTVADAVPNITFAVPPVAHLRRAMERALTRSRREVEVARLTYQISIGEMIGRLRSRVARAVTPRSFSSLLDSDTREERVAGFIALLTLWRRGELDVHQHLTFGDIWVTDGTNRESTER